MLSPSHPHLFEAILKNELEVQHEHFEFEPFNSGIRIPAFASLRVPYLQHPFLSSSHSIDSELVLRTHLLRQPIFDGSTATTTTTTTTSEDSLGRTLRRQGNVPTASQAGPSSAAANPTTIISNVPARSPNPRIPSPSYQPPYPSPSPITASSSPDPQVRVTAPTRWSFRNAFIGGGNPDFTSPFRSRAGIGDRTGSRPRRTSAARLWNPTNSTPRAYPQTSEQQQQRSATRRRSRSHAEKQTVIAIPLSHPAIGSPREEGGAPGDYPLLTLPEQRQNRHSVSTGASLQVERSGSSTGSNRISLPRSVSIDIVRNKSGEPSPLAGPKLDKGKGRAVEDFEDESRATLERPHSQEVGKSGLSSRGRSIANLPAVAGPGLSFERDKGKAIMPTDLERGPTSQNPYHPGGTSAVPNNFSNTSLPHGIGPALSSNNTSIIGSDGPAGNPAEEWGPQHPCFPHVNPHVPLSSPLYQTTRIIRIRRDWMLEGDLAPTFSNLYPEILDPAGVSEQEFRSIVERINKELIPAFNPWGLRNIVDGVLGLLTGWVWDDMGLTGVKSRLRNVETYLDDWNRQMEAKSKDGLGTAPRIVPLRRTGYMNVSLHFPLTYPP